MELTINGKSYDVDVEEDMPLLWVLRDELGLTGTKYGCGIAACGACTVQMDGVAHRSCQLALGDVDGPITTIEGLGAPAALSSLQTAWVRHQVAQCGYCQPGQIVAAHAFLRENPDPTDDEIKAAMSGNICRCGTYQRLLAAIKDAAREMRNGEG